MKTQRRRSARLATPSDGSATPDISILRLFLVLIMLALAHHHHHHHSFLCSSPQLVTLEHPRLMESATTPGQVIKPKASLGKRSRAQSRSISPTNSAVIPKKKRKRTRGGKKSKAGTPRPLETIGSEKTLRPVHLEKNGLSPMDVDIPEDMKAKASAFEKSYLDRARQNGSVVAVVAAPMSIPKPKASLSSLNTPVPPLEDSLFPEDLDVIEESPLPAAFVAAAPEEKVGILLTEMNKYRALLMLEPIEAKKVKQEPIVVSGSVAAIDLTGDNDENKVVNPEDGLIPLTHVLSRLANAARSIPEAKLDDPIEDDEGVDNDSDPDPMYTRLMKLWRLKENSQAGRPPPYDKGPPDSKYFFKLQRAMGAPSLERVIMPHWAQALAKYDTAHVEYIPNFRDILPPHFRGLLENLRFKNLVAKEEGDPRIFREGNRVHFAANATMKSIDMGIEQPNAEESAKCPPADQMFIGIMLWLQFFSRVLSPPVFHAISTVGNSMSLRDCASHATMKGTYTLPFGLWKMLGGVADKTSPFIIIADQNKTETMQVREGRHEPTLLQIEMAPGSVLWMDSIPPVLVSFSDRRNRRHGAPYSSTRMFMCKANVATRSSRF